MSLRKSPILQENWRYKAKNKKLLPLRDAIQPRKIGAGKNN